ncbi:STAS domain-containing protein [Pseudomonas aeruginosa]|nr:STAS domain-containing protein [Pseudomonas aeruginosa]
MPALGAVLLLAGWGLIDVQALKGFWKLSRFEFSLCLLTTVGVSSVGVLPGIFVAVSIAVLRLLCHYLSPERRGARLDARHRRPGRAGQVPAGHHSSRPGDLPLRRPPLFFNADYFKQRVLAVVDGSERPNAVLLNAEAMTNLDISGLATLHEVQQILKAQGVHLSLAR